MFKWYFLLHNQVKLIQFSPWEILCSLQYNEAAFHCKNRNKKKRENLSIWSIRLQTNKQKDLSFLFGNSGKGSPPPPPYISNQSMLDPPDPQMKCLAFQPPTSSSFDPDSEHQISGGGGGGGERVTYCVGCLLLVVVVARFVEIFVWLYVLLHLLHRAAVQWYPDNGNKFPTKLSLNFIYHATSQCEKNRWPCDTFTMVKLTALCVNWGRLNYYCSIKFINRCWTNVSV